MKRQNIIAIGVIVFAVIIVVGYALFQESLNITGTATAAGDFNVDFTEVGSPTCKGYSGTCDAESLATIQGGGNTLNVTVNKLDYPSAYVIIPVTITNKGSISAELSEIRETNLAPEDKAIKVTYSGVAASDTEIRTGETQTMNIKVEWDPEKNEPGEQASFNIELVYEQYVAGN